MLQPSDVFPTKYHAGFILTAAAVEWNTKLARTGEYSRRASPSRTKPTFTMNKGILPLTIALGVTVVANVNGQQWNAPFAVSLFPPLASMRISIQVAQQQLSTARLPKAQPSKANLASQVLIPTR